MVLSDIPCMSPPTKLRLHVVPVMSLPALVLASIWKKSSLEQSPV